MLKNITLFAFTLIAFSFTTIAFRLGTGPLGFPVSSLIKRDTTLNTGGPDPADNLLTIGYATFSDDFIHKIRAATTSEEATTILNDELKPKALNYVDACYKTTNASAKAAGRTNTAARIFWVPTDDTKYEIDPVYNLDLPIKTACWERALHGDINVPLFDHSSQLLQQFHWDKGYAQAYLTEQHKRFKPYP